MTKPGFLKDKEHLVALGGLFVAGLMVFAVVRAALVPRDFGLYGHFRAGALADNRQRPLVYAGHATCEACHSDVAAVHDQGRHAGVSCEACHGPLAAHADAPDKVKGRRPDGRQLCLGCHAANAAKPKSFPQIVAPHRPEGEQKVKS